jgi:S-adenosylmethionine/arginine decarboxylase-like enzyme
MHVWDETDLALMQFDVYTCGALDIKKVFEALDVFVPQKMEYKFLDREHGLNHVSHGMIDKFSEYSK